ncbi:hypothetical protein AB4356_25465, partial [Vibrio lentus]
IEVQTAQSSYGASAAQSLISLSSMLWYAIPAFVVVSLHRSTNSTIQLWRERGTVADQPLLNVVVCNS